MSKVGSNQVKGEGGGGGGRRTGGRKCMGMVYEER